jgi:hypothetical protein
MLAAAAAASNLFGCLNCSAGCLVLYLIARNSLLVLQRDNSVDWLQCF